ncbi:MAG: hypothetical protein ACKVON_14895, partial [Beijerinckiaceae bacterium]
FLRAEQRAGVALARCLLPRPSILVIDGALSSFSTEEAGEILARVRHEMHEKSIIVTQSQPERCTDFDAVLTFENTRMTSIHFLDGKDTVPKKSGNTLKQLPGSRSAVDMPKHGV